MEGKPKFEGAPDPDKASAPGEVEKEFYGMLEGEHIQEVRLEISKIRGMQSVVNELFTSGKCKASSTFDELLKELVLYESPEPPRKTAAKELRGALRQYQGKLPNKTVGELLAWLTEYHDKLMDELAKTEKPEGQH